MLGVPVCFFKMADSAAEKESLVNITHELYSYVPLSYEKRDDQENTDIASESMIRLLHLLSGTSSDPLECSLEAVRPFVNPLRFTEILTQGLIHYEALSYVWGDPMKTEYLICNGKLLEINASLATALRALRRPDASRTLWADGICINQQDMDERAS